MQEHIRRAHPEYYLPKLPATKESFELMINTPAARAPPHKTPTTPTNTMLAATSSSNTITCSTLIRQGLSPAFALDGGAELILRRIPRLWVSTMAGYYTAGDAEAAAIYNSMQAQQRSSDDYRRGSLIPAASGCGRAGCIALSPTRLGLGRRWHGTGDPPFTADVADCH